jgi:DNA-binding Lrp family transcriptional regulator
MTIKEISEITNVSRSTVLRKIKDLFPEILESGKTTRMNKEQSVKLVENIKKGFIQPIQNEQELIQNEQVIIQFTKALDIFSKTMENIDKRLSNLENTKQLDNNIKLLPETKKITAKEYAEKNNIKSYNQNSLLNLATRECTRLAKDLNRSIDYKNNIINGYPEAYFDEDLLSTAFLVARKKQELKNDLFKDVEK